MLTEFKNQILELLKNFYTASKIRVAVFDKNGKELFAYPEGISCYCKELRNNKENEIKCEKCNSDAFNKAKTNKPFFYYCHSGLAEAIAPVRYDGDLICFLMMGQIKSEKTPFVDNENFSKLPYYNEDEIKAFLNILEAYCSHLMANKLIRLKSETIREGINELIKATPLETLSIDFICEKLGVSRATIYRNFENPAEEIRKVKIEKACQLLLSTTLSVSDISYYCGFSDYNYFTKTFKKIVGFSPSDYKKKNSNSI